MKLLPNILTAIRLLGSPFLFFFVPFSIPFLILYSLLGITDMLAGWLARKWNCQSSAGAFLDSIADLVMILVLFMILFIHFTLPGWLTAGIVIILGLRLSSSAIAFIRFKTLAFLHTYLNKAAGFCLFLTPLLIFILGFSLCSLLILSLCLLSALEELILLCIIKELNSDIPGIFSRF